MPKRRTVKDGPGTVYILTNEAFQCDMLKIGRTGRSMGATLRAKNLQTTGVPLPFKVENELSASNMIKTERNAHDLLIKYRVADNREFFKVSLEKANATVRQARAFANWSALQNACLRVLKKQNVRI